MSANGRTGTPLAVLEAPAREQVSDWSQALNAAFAVGPLGDPVTRTSAQRADAVIFHEFDAARTTEGIVATGEYRHTGWIFETHGALMFPRVHRDRFIWCEGRFSRCRHRLRHECTLSHRHSRLGHSHSHSHRLGLRYRHTLGHRFTHEKKVEEQAQVQEVVVAVLGLVARCHRQRVTSLHRPH